VKRTKYLTWAGLSLMSIQFGLLARLTWFEYSWDIMEPVTYFVGYGTLIATFAYYVLTKQVRKVYVIILFLTILYLRTVANITSASSIMDYVSCNSCSMIIMSNIESVFLLESFSEISITTKFNLNTGIGQILCYDVRLFVCGSWYD